MLVEISTRRSRNLRKKEKEKKRKRSVESSDGLEIRIRNEYLDRDDRGSIVHTHDDVIYRRKSLENWLRIHACDDSDFSEPLSPARLTRKTMSLETRDDRLKIISLDRVVDGAWVARVFFPLWLTRISPRENTQYESGAQRSDSQVNEQSWIISQSFFFFFFSLHRPLYWISCQNISRNRGSPPHPPLFER